MVLDDYQEGIPVAWALSNREDKLLLVHILQVIREVSPTFLMLIPGQLHVDMLTTPLINMPHPLINDVYDPIPVFHAYLLCKSIFCHLFYLYPSSSCLSP